VAQGRRWLGKMLLLAVVVRVSALSWHYHKE
jgi:hypothetical protein